MGKAKKTLSGITVSVPIESLVEHIRSDGSGPGSYQCSICGERGTEQIYDGKAVNSAELGYPHYASEDLGGPVNNRFLVHTKDCVVGKRLTEEGQPRRFSK